MAKRKISLAAIKGAIESPRTPLGLKQGLFKKYGKELLKQGYSIEKKKIIKGINPKKMVCRTRKKSINKARRKKNIQEGFMRDGIFHPIRASYDYDPRKTGEGLGSKWEGKKLRTPLSRKRKNPPVEIYGQVLRIEAKKGNNSLYPKEEFYHDFPKNTKAKILGLPDGSLLIKGKKPLWRKFKQ